MATVRINEANGAGQTITTNVANTNMGSVDASALDPVANPIVAGQNSFEKWQRIELVSLDGSSALRNLKIWRTGALGANATHLTNARTSAYAGAATYATPTAATSSVATQTMPTTEPGTANLGIGGALAGQLAAPGSSDYLVHQIQTTASATAGTTTTLNYQYDLIA